jgi:hypothetical protein
MPQAEIFEQIYQDYLAQVAGLDLARVAERLGLELDRDEVTVPLFGRLFRVSPRGVADSRDRRPSHSVSVILCRHLIMCPEAEPTAADWVTYRVFKDGGPFVVGFRNNAEKPIARMFSGRPADLAAACEKLGGRPAQTEVSCDLALRLPALPKLPMLLLFNDRDEDFKADCSLLFEKRAEQYLDMECLAMVGWALAEWLKM